jgi:hypothetical protein
MHDGVCPILDSSEIIIIKPAGVPDRKLVIVDLVPSAVMNTLKLIRVRCRKEAVWRVGIHKGTSESLLSKESEAAMPRLN